MDDTTSMAAFFDTYGQALIDLVTTESPDDGPRIRSVAIRTRTDD